MKSPNFFAELKRRNVIPAVILYVSAVWALAQGISQVGPSVGGREWATRSFLVAAAIGFPFWIAFAWFYEFTPEGLKRESEIDRAESITHRTERFVPPFNLAIVYLGLGDHARALDYLEQASAADSQWMMYLKVDRIFDPLRSDPRFIALMKKCHFEK